MPFLAIATRSRSLLLFLPAQRYRIRILDPADFSMLIPYHRKKSINNCKPYLLSRYIQNAVWLHHQILHGHSRDSSFLLKSSIIFAFWNGRKPRAFLKASSAERFEPNLRALRMTTVRPGSPDHGAIQVSRSSSTIHSRIFMPTQQELGIRAFQLAGIESRPRTKTPRSSARPASCSRWPSWGFQSVLATSAPSACPAWAA